MGFLCLGRVLSLSKESGFFGFVVLFFVFKFQFVLTFEIVVLSLHYVEPEKRLFVDFVVFVLFKLFDFFDVLQCGVFL